MIYFFIVFYIIITFFLLILLINNSQNESDKYTTFLGSDYSILIKGVLTKAHVQEAIDAIGTIKGVQIGTLVTSIGNADDDINIAPFVNQASITSLTFKGTSVCKLIGNNAFYGCTSLTSVVIPNSVTSIENYAFTACNNLASITIPNSVTSIGTYVFYNCTSLVSITIPDSVTSIEIGTFDNCTSLVSITIPNSVTSIASNVFYGCTSLVSITIPDLVTSIGNNVFYGCTSLVSITIPDLVTSIGNNAFISCTSLVSIIIGNLVTSIGDSAFDSCPLAYVQFRGNTVDKNITIGTNAFTAPDSLLEVLTNGGGTLEVLTVGNIYVPVPTTYTTFTGTRNYSFSIIGELTKTDVDQAIAIVGTITSVQFGTTVTSIGNNSDTTGTSPFYNQINIVSMSFKNTSTCITFGQNVFNSCTSLSSFDIPNSVTSIAGSAFTGCTGLISVTIGNSVASIGAGAFASCTNLISVTIPDSVTNISLFAFSSCTSLASVVIGNSLTSIAISTFASCTSLALLTIGTSVTSIGAGAFSVSPLTRVEFTPGNARNVNINTSAFISPSSLVSAVPPGGGDISVLITGNIYT